MLEQFLHHIKQNSLFAPHEKVLLAVSGGLDSMVMLHLFKKAGLSAGVAHCHFGLRGQAADGDEMFVKQAAEANAFPCYTTRFDTAAYARGQGLSVQMAARALRYAWFESVCGQHGYAVVATAHHLNDVLETTLLNLAKGTGLDGLAGIPVKYGKVVRPLLFASRRQVEAYAAANSIAWREDASNESDHYQRNLIRHHVVPLLQQINPGLEESFLHTHERIKGGRDLARRFLGSLSGQAVTQAGDKMLIDKAALMSAPYAPVVMWEMIKDLGFNYPQCIEIAGTPHQPGKIFDTDTHRLTVDRDKWIITTRPGTVQVDVQIDRGQEHAECDDAILELQVLTRKEFRLRKEPAVGQFDAGRLTFPLRWRGWREGDRFVPLGMHRHKKISDLLVDEKVPLPDKRKVTVLESDGEIAWVVGRRVADPFKVTDATNTVLVITVRYKPHDTQ